MRLYLNFLHGVPDTHIVGTLLQTRIVYIAFTFSGNISIIYISRTNRIK